MRVVLSLALAVVLAGCSDNPPVVILMSVDGPSSWPTRYLLGGTETWAMVGHSDSLPDLIAGIHEGFLRPWSFGTSGGMRGQGSLLTLAAREGWSTAVFASVSTDVRPALERLSNSASDARIRPAGLSNWPLLANDVVLWAASHDAPRFATVHLSVTDPPTPEAMSAVVQMWARIDDLIRGTGDSSALLAVYLADAPPGDSMARLRVVGSVPGATAMRDTWLSTLDVAPTVASVLNVLYTPDYLGQSLAALSSGQRSEPVVFTRGTTRMVMGSRWMVVADEFEDDALPSRVRFVDLWRGEFSASGTRSPEALKLLEHLPHR
ncbi:hypothetical protein JXA88_00805 [Candidatus Fermentibacteria bacterium]|nr:hypothetical protein [Candidatus Fermentibacteria bacterium]